MRETGIPPAVYEVHRLGDLRLVATRVGQNPVSGLHAERWSPRKGRWVRTHNRDRERLLVAWATYELDCSGTPALDDRDYRKPAAWRYTDA